MRFFGVAQSAWPNNRGSRRACDKTCALLNASVPLTTAGLQN